MKVRNLIYLGIPVFRLSIAIEVLTSSQPKMQRIIKLLHPNVPSVPCVRHRCSNTRWPAPTTFRSAAIPTVKMVTDIYAYMCHDVVNHIIRESRQHAHRERTGFLPLAAPRGRGGRVYIVISDVAASQTLVGIVFADPTCRDFLERTARKDLVTTMDAERWKETQY